MPPALRIGIWMRAIGLPVWEGHRRVCHFFFIHFVRTDFAHAYRVQFLRYRNESLQAHCPRGGIVTFKKNLGVGPPRGEIFSQNFFRDFVLKICGSHAPYPGKNIKKKFSRSET